MVRLFRSHPPLMLFALLMTALTLASVVGLVADDRTLLGDPIWLKPFKFAVSLALYAVTLTWMLTFVTRFTRTARWAGTLIALGGTVEMVIIVGQVVRGKQSHFNVATPFDQALWNAMAGTIVTVWLMHLVISLILVFTPFADRVAGLAIRLGLFVALIGLALGMFMPRNVPPGQDPAKGILGSHVVGVPDGGPTMAVTGWATDGGDLRIGHFVGIHALQVIPLIALLLAGRATTRLIWGVSIGYLGLTALVTWQALRGQALLRPDTATLLGALVVVGWTAGAVLVGLRRKQAVAA
ncbi:hypothetical protein [Actinosynnema sp. NPDC020468]|uniref:hypothetical protein n=1 Tax=Actinosynnema sp. NPDC020468 TaxID=3154488 RepID=UPI0033FF6F04